MRLIRDEGQPTAVVFEAGDEAIQEQYEVFIQALRIYAERNVKYKDNWKRMGWRGQLVRIRERAERLWDDFWDRETETVMTELGDADDAIDLINFAAFFVRAVGARDRDGSWWGRP